MKKRILSVLLSLFIICGVVLADYERVMAVDIPTAFWGTLEASRAWFTAMQAGGAFDRGISFESFVRSSSEDWKKLERATMEAFKLFLIQKFGVEVANKYPSWTPSEVISEATRLATITANSFKENAIEVQNTTKEGITVQDFKYWHEFCKEFASVAKNGLGSGSMTPTTVINTPIYNILAEGNSAWTTNNPKTNIGANTFLYDDKYYIGKGQLYNPNTSQVYNIQFDNVPTDRIRLGYLSINVRVGYIYLHFWSSDINRLTGEVIVSSTQSITSSLFPDVEIPVSSGYVSLINSFIDKIDFPVLIDDMNFVYAHVKDWSDNYKNNLSVSVDGTASTTQSMEAINQALNETEAGQAIKDGNSKQSTKTVVREGSVPIKRSSLKEEERNGEKVVSGDIGWDIPGTKTITAPIVDDTKEDEFIEDIGIIDVPEDIVIDDPVPGEIVIPGEEEVVIPVTPDVPIPIIKILEIQYGPFYPTAMEGLEEFFPFCIPFDIAYCVNKFRVGEGEAPVLNIPIVYPRALQGVLGQSYNVTIDFNDYIALRNIIRYFILILFIAGLMTLTRNIIRG